MAKKNKSKSNFKVFFVLTCIGVGAFVYYDVNRAGNWQKSNTNQLLKTYGIYEYSTLCVNWTHHKLLLLSDQIEEYFPGYQKTVVYYIEPYIELSQNIGRIVYNVYADIKEKIVRNYPVTQSIGTYAPQIFDQTVNTLKNIWSASIFYAGKSVDYLREEVFVGQLSPENMQKVVNDALNVTQHKAVEYYHWLYEKVHSVIK